MDSPIPDNEAADNRDEITAGDVYEAIADQLASARTRALMGERATALSEAQGAWLEYRRFQDILTAFPGHHALEFALAKTIEALCLERSEFERSALEAQPAQHKAAERTAHRRAA